MVLVDVKAPGSKATPFSPFGFDVGDESGHEIYRVRHLIAKLVRESVRDFHMRERQNAFAALTTEKIEEDLKTGKLGRAREETQKVDLSVATGQALQAFEDGLYLLFVDDDEKRSLEDIVNLQPETRITIFRLTALAGR